MIDVSIAKRSSDLCIYKIELHRMSPNLLHSALCLLDVSSYHLFRSCRSVYLCIYIDFSNTGPMSHHIMPREVYRLALKRGL